jgi:hypothetical protein
MFSYDNLPAEGSRGMKENVRGAIGARSPTALRGRGGHRLVTVGRRRYIAVTVPRRLE